MLHDETLRVALRAMLDDLTYPERDKGRPWVEARLREATWTAARRWMLVRKLIVWGQTSDSVQAAALAKALEAAWHELCETKGGG